MQLKPLLRQTAFNTAIALLTRAQPGPKGPQISTKNLENEALAASLAASLDQLESANPGIMAKYGWVCQG